ncbi:hypothetical protein ABMC88_13035 [Sulfitobacter sp. HNIBRBA2951]|uniref:hypothetical protein n=1 Tax=Sulfitobacter aquimarinus TaxID=3158557 RepID=UPI0032DEB198
MPAVLGAGDQHIETAICLQMVLKSVRDVLPARDRGIAIDHVDFLKTKRVTDDFTKAKPHVAVFD